MGSHEAYFIFFFKIQGLKAGLEPTMFLTLPLPEAWGYRLSLAYLVHMVLGSKPRHCARQTSTIAMKLHPQTGRRLLPACSNAFTHVCSIS